MTTQASPHTSQILPPTPNKPLGYGQIAYTPIGATLLFCGLLLSVPLACAKSETEGAKTESAPSAKQNDRTHHPIAAEPTKAVRLAQVEKIEADVKALDDGLKALDYNLSAAKSSASKSLTQEFTHFEGRKDASGETEFLWVNCTLAHCLGAALLTTSDGTQASYFDPINLWREDDEYAFSATAWPAWKASHPDASLASPLPPATLESVFDRYNNTENSEFTLESALTALGPAGTPLLHEDGSQQYYGIDATQCTRLELATMKDDANKEVIDFLSIKTFKQRMNDEEFAKCAFEALVLTKTS